MASLGSTGDLPGQFNRPTNVAVDQTGDIYVTDLSVMERFLFPVAVEVDSQARVAVLETGRHRIQVYQKQTD